jgi:predicted aldo/keto reductase-like oxidoreductase
MEKRPFGKTGVELPILSLGCQRLVDEEGCSQDQAVAIFEEALKRGVCYFDTVLGCKVLATDWQRALRYSMGLSVTTVITGCSTIEQLDGNIDLAENFIPMTSVERLAFFRDILPMVAPQNMPWKSKDWARKDWIERKEPFGLTRTGCQ